MGLNLYSLEKEYIREFGEDVGRMPGGCREDAGEDVGVTGGGNVLDITIS